MPTQHAEVEFKVVTNLLAGRILKDLTKFFQDRQDRIAPLRQGNVIALVWLPRKGQADNITVPRVQPRRLAVKAKDLLPRQGRDQFLALFRRID